jgi:hypothetical protein
MGAVRGAGWQSKLDRGVEVKEQLVNDILVLFTKDEMYEWVLVDGILSLGILRAGT